jgi:CheY-like chemotaxis protein
MLGGRIIAESELGVGSRFTLYVPSHHPGAPTVRGRAELRASSTPDATAPPALPAATTGADTGGDDAAPIPGDVFDNVGSPSPERLVFDTLSPGALGRDSLSPEIPSPDELLGKGATGALDPREDTWPETTRLKEWLSGRPGRVLAGRRILIVDDDIRNVFALTHALGRVGLAVKYAENGREGLEVLQRFPDVSLVLMDIMMPEMDGYETIHTIRSTPRLAHLPIIALTAKAMPGDREKAIDSGASDYIPKPVDVDRLLSVICDLLDPPDGSDTAVPDSPVPQQGDATEDDDHDPPEREP